MDASYWQPAAALRPNGKHRFPGSLFSLRITCAQHAAIPLMPPLLLNEHAIITQFLPGLLRSTDQLLSLPSRLRSRIPDQSTVLSSALLCYHLGDVYSSP
jgi:hypothetical protein